ncbi:MAG: alpha-mannosidase [Candidatus Aminicenantes bacterium]|nr:alpha-mannosidase [Candidatus Aminicenantes bacterium]
MKRIHLVANAHLDPVWLWEWQEGAGEALSTFRQAAEFCENHPGFVFCHNEAVLYEWVEEHEPALFRRIRKLIRQKKWHVMGGWYVQPDCNMPSGESFVRQILLGKRYFAGKFGVEPRTAVNLDPFGHTRGLVQIVAKSGHTAYLCCRPGDKECPLPRDEFVWVGYDGSEVLANRASAHYCSVGGKERERLETWLAEHPEKGLVVHLWGIGNHGGGPSRKDLEDLGSLARERPDLDIVHSTPDAYFEELEADRANLPRREQDLNPWAVGCYTSMSRVKRGHRRLENELYSAEKMAVAAWMNGLIPYPAGELKEAEKDLAFTEFHDILPGSCIPAGEEGAVRRIGHGLEILSRIKARAFFALAAGEPKAAPGTMPLFVHNPHPYPVRTIVECEFEPWEPNYDKSRWAVRLSERGKDIPCQTEKEDSNLSVEWRKKVVFEAELPPSRLSRFDARLEPVKGTLADAKPATVGTVVSPERIGVETADLAAAVNSRTGLLDTYRVGGVEFLEPGAFAPLVIADNADPWGMKVRGFRSLEGRFALPGPAEAARVSGLGGEPLPPVRLVEDGPVRAVVEAVLRFGDSAVILTYKLPKRGAGIEVEVRVLWNEKDKMLKLSLPSKLSAPRFMGQVAFGADELPMNGDEAVSQKWLALVSEADGAALTVVNDGVYGSDFRDGELRLSLLRSPAYAADTWENKLAVARDRFVPRQDQGERLFRFWVHGGPLEERMERIGREAQVRNERPYALAYGPPGTGRKPKPALVLDGLAVECSALKRSEDGRDVVVRLFEPTGRDRAVTLRLPVFGVKKKIRMRGFEVRTFRFDRRSKRFVETDLLERRAGRR